MIYKIALIIILLLSSLGIYFYSKQTHTSGSKHEVSNTSSTPIPSAVNHQFPLSIAAMKAKSYPGSPISIEQTLSPGSNYNRYLVSYKSDGLKIFALLAVPQGKKPEEGWPVILLNHGYIPPAQYSTVNSYAALVDPLASQGYIVFKPDYRGNGNSEGRPTQVYVSSDYVTDSMNALESIKQYKDVNPNEIGVFGHSMGGNITLHELVITHDLKAAELWAGVVGSYSNILSWWNQRIADNSIQGNDLETAHLIQQFVQTHGSPRSNPVFWNSIDPTHFISDISTPVQIQVGTGDTEVPYQFSEELKDSLLRNGKYVSFYEYPEADHNLSPNQTQALQHTIQFFNKYLK